MNTKLALEILLWCPNSKPFYDVYDVQVIEHFWTRRGKKWLKKWSDSTGRKANSRLSEMHDQLRDEALTHIAQRIDGVV